MLLLAVGFLDGPDPWDEFFYPEAEMWVDWVKFWDLNDIGDVPDYDYTCVANPNSSAEDLCGAASWACYEQNYANMGGFVMTIGNDVVNDILALTKKQLTSALESFLNTIHSSMMETVVISTAMP